VKGIKFTRAAVHLSLLAWLADHFTAGVHAAATQAVTQVISSPHYICSKTALHSERDYY